MRNEKEPTDDIKQLFEVPEEPKGLSQDWFERIEAMDTKTNDEIDQWIAKIEDYKRD